MIEPYSVLIGVLIFSMGVALLSLGFWIFKKDPKNRVNASFLIFTVSYFLWTSVHLVTWAYPLEYLYPNFLSNVAYIGPSFIFSLFVYFAYVFPENKGELPWFKLVLIYVFPVVMAPIIFFEKISYDYYYVQNEISVYWNWGVYIFSAFMVLYIFWGVSVLVSKMNRKRGRAKRAIKTVLLGFFIGVSIGGVLSLFIPLVLGDNRFLAFSPSLSGFFVFVVLAYAIVRYDLMNIRIIAKKALFYAIVVFLGTLLLGSFFYLNSIIEYHYPLLSYWLTPFIFSLVAVSLGLYVWRGMKETEELKKDFITVVTHKFRTPITRITWAIESLKNEELTDTGKDSINVIDYSSKNILELLELLITVSEERGKFRSFHRDVDMSSVCREVLNEEKKIAQQKGVEIKDHIAEGMIVSIEERSARFIIKVLLENALTYTPRGGEVSINLSVNNNNARLEVKDTGIGIDSKTKGMIFSMFFRGSRAKTKYTEGLGVGLYITKNIVEDLGGSIGFHSEGEGKGSTFYIEFPLSKKKIKSLNYKNKEDKS